MEVFATAIENSNVVARVEPEIKEEAEAILAQLGISASDGINMFYRHKGEFDAKMARGIEQAKAGEGVPVEEFFALLRQEISS